MPTTVFARMGSAAVLAALAGCAGQATVSYQDDVQPILEEYCASCHTGEGSGVEASGFRVDSYEAVMKGTHYGPVVIEGDALSSSLYRLVAGEVDPSIQMPHGEAKLSDAQIETIETWIDQGAVKN